MAISVGSVEVDVVPNTRGIYRSLRSSLVSAATRAGEDAGNAAGRAMQASMADVGDRIGRQVGSQIATRITGEIRGALRDGITQGGRTARPAATRQGNQTGGAFARAARARIEAAFRSLPDITIGADTSEADADLQALRARMETLSGRTIGVDLDAGEARAEITDIEEQLRRLGAAHPNVAVRADTAAARAQLAELRGELDRISADPTRVRLETDGTFGQRLRAAVQQAQSSIPDINIGADTSPAQAELARLRAQLATLADQRVGIDIDAATAQTRISDLQARLERLSASDADVAVRVDAGSAAAQLATVQAMVNRLDGQTARIDVDTRGAMSALLQLSVALGSVAALPAIPVIGAGIGAIGAASVAAGAGVGALAAAAIPALSGIKSALDAQKQAQEAAATATAKGGQAAAQAARQSLQMEGAQQALAAAHRNASRQIASAEQGVQDAVRQAADANRRAAQQVTSARQRLADTVQQVADRQRAAAEQVQRAEESLADAQRTARQAQQDLNQARADAAEELEDLSSRLANAQLSERDAALSVQEARKRLRQTQAAGSRATLLEQQRAQLAYDQAVQRLKDQRNETADLAAEKAAADRAGVEGSDTVRRAQERLSAAQESVRDQAANLARAQQDAARQQVRSQQDIARAQAQVAEAQRNVTSTQEQGARQVARAQQQLAAAQQSAADSIASAQRQIRSAQLSAAGGANQAATAQAKYKAELAKLTPSARGTFDAFTRLRTAFKGWSRELQPAVMPIFTRALNGMRKALPGLTPFVREAADAIGDLQDRASKGFQSKGWKQFKKDLSGSVRPAIIGLGVAIGNIGKGVGGIIQAFLPHMDTISQRMQEITGRFADWGTSLKGSPEFERFLSYAADMGPKLARTLGDIGSAFLEVSRALSPLSGPALEILGALARGIASIAETLPWLIQGMYLALIATRLWSIGMALFNAVMNANPITLIIIAIIALVAAVVYAYKNWDWFREAVQKAWHYIQVAALWAWRKVLKPVFEFIGDIILWLWRKIIKPYFTFMVAYWKWVGRIAMWLWDKILKPVFNAIGAIIKWWWNNIVKRYFSLVMDIFRALAKVGKWLWKKAIKPAFDGIGDIFSWLWKKVVKPVFGWIADKTKWLWRHGIKPWFEIMKRGVKKIADAFRDAKDGIGKAWDKLKNLTKKPIKWVIDFVYNKGVRGLWNKAASVLPIKKLPKFNPKGWARGGVLPGYQSAKRDDIWHPMRSGEGVLVPEVVRGIGPQTVNRLNDAGNRGGVSGVRKAVGGFAEGGIVGAHGGLGDWLGGKIEALGGVLGRAKDWVLGGISSVAKAAARPIRALIDRIPGGDKGFGQLARAVPTGLLNSALSAIKGSEDSQIGGGQWAKPVNAKYGTKFGVAGHMWSSGRHTGLDFPARTGTPVRAVDNGSVAYARSGGPYGNHILIRHSKHLASMYAHLSSMLVRSGAVRRGQQIGRVGATGNVTGPHLHLEARRDGRPVNPMPYLSGGAGGFSARASGANQRLAKIMLSRYGWTAGQFGPLKQLWQHESGWNHRARNPSSGAYGIPQALPATKMASAGPDWRTNPATQIRWGLGYIRGRYGTPASAWSFWQRQQPHWYDSGGYLQPGLNLAYNGTGRPEPVFTTAQSNALTRMADERAGADLGDLHVQVFVGDREITDIARAEVHRSNGDLVTALRAGRNGR